MGCSLVLFCSAEVNRVTCMITFFLFCKTYNPSHKKYGEECTFLLGFTKDRPAAQRPAMAQRPGGPEAKRPAARGPAARWPAAHDGPAARSRFSTVFCPAVNPCACTGLHRVWACKVDDGELEFVYHYNIKQSFRSFHSLHVAT